VRKSSSKVFEVLSLGCFLSIEIFIWTLNVDLIVLGMNTRLVPPVDQLRRVVPIVIFGGAYSYWFWRYMDQNSHGLKMLAGLNWLADKLPWPGPAIVRFIERCALTVYHTALGFNRTRSRKMFLVGASPIPGARAASGVYCGLTHWWQGMAMLMLGDLTKTFYEVSLLSVLARLIVWLWHLFF
jgi:hypothetical protein